MAEGIIRRGSIVAVIIPGDFGKPRPAVVIQADLFTELETVLVCPLTSDLSTVSSLRPELAPSVTNGLLLTSQIMLDKLTAIRKSRIRNVIGKADDDLMRRVSRELALLIGLGG